MTSCTNLHIDNRIFDRTEMMFRKSPISRSSHSQRHSSTTYIMWHSLNAGVRNLFWQRGSEIGDKIDVNSHLARSSRRWLLPGGFPGVSISFLLFLQSRAFLSPSLFLSLSLPHVSYMPPFCEEKRARIRVRKDRWCRAEAPRGNGGRLLQGRNGGGRAEGR